MDKSLVEIAKESLRSARQDLLGELSKIDLALNALESNVPVVNNIPAGDPPLTDPNYSREWSYQNKFQYILKREGRFLHTREAAEILVSIEGGDVEQVVKRIAGSIGDLKRDGRIVKILASNRLQDTFWGSPKWLDDKGKIKAGHEYDENYVYGKSKENPDFEI